MAIVEVEVPMAHRSTGSDWRGQLHRAHQLADVARALAIREPAVRAVASHLPAGALAAGAARRPAIRAVRPPQG